MSSILDDNHERSNMNWRTMYQSGIQAGAFIDLVMVGLAQACLNIHVYMHYIVNI